MGNEFALQRRGQLRAFLRARRERIAPADVGIPAAGRRRTPGLRREEVALLAGVGVSWYTWLEQGRDITVSAGVLDAVAEVLRLSEPERVHLHLLAGLIAPAVREAPGDEVGAEARRLLDAWGPRPAMLRDRYWNILAFNDTARAVFGFDGSERNCLVTFFTNPRYREMREVWAAAAPAVVAAYRADAAHLPGDPRFSQVVDGLRAVSPDFADLWERYEVGDSVPAVNALWHPEVGEMFFDATTLTIAHHPSRHLVLYDPRPGTDTAERIERLAKVVAAHPR